MILQGLYKVVQLLLLLGIAVVDPFNTLKLLISLAKSSCLQCLTIACKIWAICLQESPNSHHIDSFNHSNWLETGFIRWVLSTDFVSQWEKWLPYYFHIGVNLSVRESQSSSVPRSCGSDPCEEACFWWFHLCCIKIAITCLCFITVRVRNF